MQNISVHPRVKLNETHLNAANVPRESKIISTVYENVENEHVCCAIKRKAHSLFAHVQRTSFLVLNFSQNEFHITRICFSLPFQPVRKVNIFSLIMTILQRLSLLRFSSGNAVEQFIRFFFYHLLQYRKLHT